MRGQPFGPAEAVIESLARGRHRAAKRRDKLLCQEALRADGLARAQMQPMADIAVDGADHPVPVAMQAQEPGDPKPYLCADDIRGAVLNEARQAMAALRQDSGGQGVGRAVADMEDAARVIRQMREGRGLVDAPGMAQVARAVHRMSGDTGAVPADRDPGGHGTRSASFKLPDEA